MSRTILKGAKLLKEKIEEFDYIVIFRHQSPDFDAFGCQLGLKSWIQDNYPNKTVKAVGNNHIVFTKTLYPEMDVVSDEELNSQEFLAIICDTGDTALAWREKGYKIATMFYKKGSKVCPDFWRYEKEDKWIVFPWE